jgi:RimJ/RimL family protein N-acetyltransferase
MSLELQLRPVTMADARRIWVWSNDRETRRHSFCTAAIPWSDHLPWLERKLADPRCRFYIAETDGRPIGQVRFDREDDDSAVISISIDPDHRGRGLGTAAIRAAIARLQQDAPVTVVHALIKKTNPASLRAFHNAGFRDSHRSLDHEVTRLSLRPQRRQMLP